MAAPTDSKTPPRKPAAMLRRLSAGRFLPGRWRGSNWLVLPLALPLFLALGLATGTAINLGLSGEWIGRQDTGRLLAAEPGSRQSVDGTVDACGRIQSIVETACGLRQHDHDSAGIRQCVAYELKYTMWSAYGCR